MIMTGYCTCFTAIMVIICITAELYMQICSADLDSAEQRTSIQSSLHRSFYCIAIALRSFYCIAIACPERLATPFYECKT